ncbi:hypothetical protein GQ43DRAFT_449310 [Delitschia confertaspora ATCC 74209]|uniref:F-box domain-containing protein n=1 Tax=Delitschia confertaspora ATCC 74209 TaxID=1513339 RepID=A0A9P4MS82_9PLEO|nr:hypothetical protein GQ43DRAFT_449310 [Delitschia confertaspora ATCC 74209]
MPRPQIHLPNEILFEILDYIPRGRRSQNHLWAFCLVSRQWYHIGIARLYEEPFLIGPSYDRFVRTICPSINAHIRKSDLAGLVRILDLSHIVHQGSKSITARLLGRTKANLETFVAPQASFAINCWAALSKCRKLKYLNLSLVSECINYQSLTQAVRHLGELRELYLPRCSFNYEDACELSMVVKWPPKLRLLQLSGGVHGKFIYDLTRQPENFPPTLSHLSISHCPRVLFQQIQSLIESMSHLLRHLELRDLPQVQMGQLSRVLTWAPQLQSLTIAMDYIDIGMGSLPVGWSPSRWAEGHPLESLTLVTSGHQDPDSDAYFTAVDLFTMIDERYLSRLRYIYIAESTGWTKHEDEGDEIGAIRECLTELDQENWENRRWHYRDIDAPNGVTYEEWISNPQNKKWKPRVEVVRWQ